MSNKKPPKEELDVEVVLQTGSKTKEERPPMYMVVLYNDDYTPMDFVVEVLMQFFAISGQEANRIMLKVHNEGRGECGVYTRDIAEAKVLLVNEYARHNQHPLLCQMERCE